MTYSNPQPQDDSLIESVLPAVLVDTRGPPPWVRHPNHVPQFDYLIDIESFPQKNEFGDSEGDPILEKVRGYKNACQGPSDNDPNY
jgi:hypothetical protein